MADYSYAAMSGQVLKSKRSGPQEPTGEASSVRGKVGVNYQMGDRLGARGGNDEDFQKRVKKLKKSSGESKLVGKAAAGPSASAQDFMGPGYRPKTEESRKVYEELLAVVHKAFGDVPHELLKEGTDEVLAIQKGDQFINRRRGEVEKLLGKVSDATYHKIEKFTSRINDFSAAELDEQVAGQQQQPHPAAQANTGVAVVLDDESSDSEAFEIPDSSDDDDSADAAGPDGGARGVAQALGTAAKKGGGLPASSIDGHWIQRTLSDSYGDANVSKAKAEEVLGILQGGDERAAENHLLLALGPERFGTIKLFMKHRLKIVYCVRLHRATGAAEENAIKAEMIAEPTGAGADVLREIETGDATSQNAWDGQKYAWAPAARAAGAAATPGEAGSARARPAAKKYSKVDLKSLKFKQGSRVMSNDDVQLPDKSWRVQKKGYEEVHVPAMKNIEHKSKLVEISSLPVWARLAFGEKIKRLNPLQSKVYQSAFHSDESMLVCAPTGAGKTNVACLTMLQAMGRHVREGTSTVDTTKFKMVYIAPMKALVQETVNNFGHRLAPYNINVRELSGDQSLTKEEIMDTQLIVTTPEKWDIVTRKAGDRSYTQLVRLIIIDEIHLLHDDRGPVLESLVARTLRKVEETQEHVRIVGLSATLPNYQDVASLLRVNPDTGLFFFDGSFRPVPLQQQYIGISERKAMKRMALSNEIAYEKIVGQSPGDQVLVFVHSRKDTVKTAKALRDMALERGDLGHFVAQDGATQEILKEQATEHVQNVGLKDILPYGFGVHHAGLTKEDRTLCEDLFRDGRLQVLVSTATLAWGVNLPAHCVIIKGTQIYNPEKGAWTELSSQDVMQMIGRAGRPGFDTKGEGVIITSQDELQFYLSLLNEQLPIESQFIKKLVDNLNAEIVSGTVKNVDEAAEWLGYTYYYVRMMRNPALYGVSDAMLQRDPMLVAHRKNLIHSAACVLDQHGMLEYDRHTGSFQPTELGRIASYYYVTVDSVASFNEYLKPTLDDIGLFRIFSSGYEFRNVVVRAEEKMELKRLLQRVPVPVKEDVEDPSAKINVLLQAFISRLKLEGYALLSDMVYIQASAGRIMRAILEIVIMRGWAGLANRVLKLSQMIERRMWSSQCPLRQFPRGSLKQNLLVSLEKKSLAWPRYYDLEPHDLAELTRRPNMGRKLYSLIHKFPKLELSAQVQPLLRSLLKIDLIVMADFEFDAEVLGGHAVLFHIFVEGSNGDKILHHEMFTLKSRYMEDEHAVTFTVPMVDPPSPNYYVRVVADRWLQASTVLPVSFDQLVLPSAAAPLTELLDMSPLPVSAVQVPEFIRMFQDHRGIETFNAVQTQTFNALFETSENVLVCASSGNARIVCAELAMLRAFVVNPNACCVYVAPEPALCEERFLEWSIMFGETGLGKSVVRLTGEIQNDLRLTGTGHIVVASCEHWDQIQRRWKQRKVVQAVSLLIMDELHMIGGQQGPIMEVIVARTRLMESHFEKSYRIVGLASPVVNARPLGNWIGAKKKNQFAFGVPVRHVPVQVDVIGFRENRFANRIVEMSRPCFNSISNATAAGEPKSAIVFVASRKQSQIVAIDMMSFAAASGAPDMFVGDAAALKQSVGVVVDGALAATLQRGIGFLHEAMSLSDRAVVIDLHKRGKINLLVAARSQIWSMSRLAAKVVVVMGCCFYDGREHRFSNYAITDVLEMVGRAGRAGVDKSARCVLMCHKPKKTYFQTLVHTPIPVESHLDHVLHNTFCAEVVSKTITNKQEALDYLTWSFMYRRLTQNPNYYNLMGTTDEEVSDHLSELVESTLNDLVESKCIEIVDEMTVAPLQFGMIASYYNVQYTTIELFASSLTANSTFRGLLEVLSASSEYEALAMRHKEDRALQKLISHSPDVKINRPDWSEPHTKVHALLQLYFSRTPLSSVDLQSDLKEILGKILNLVRAMVDVISSNGWLRALLAAMELSQLVVQAQWGRDSALLQIPHFNRPLAAKCKAAGLEGVLDLIDMDDEPRNALLEFSEAKMVDIAAFCNGYPSMEVEYQLNAAISPESEVTLTVTVEREMDEEDEEYADAPVHAPQFPFPKMQGWWLVLGNVGSDSVAAIKRVAIKETAQVVLKFDAPESAGKHAYKLYLMSDAFVGCDQEVDVAIDVES
jgi:pre-mRNA-splicing helicase BRR2